MGASRHFSAAGGKINAYTACVGIMDDYNLAAAAAAFPAAMPTAPSPRSCRPLSYF